MNHDDNLQDLYMDRHDFVEDESLETETGDLNDVNDNDLFGDDDVAF